MLRSYTDFESFQKTSILALTTNFWIQKFQLYAQTNRRNT